MADGPKKTRRKRVCLDCGRWDGRFHTHDPAWARCYEMARTLGLTDPAGAPAYLGTPPDFGCVLFARKARPRPTPLPLKPKEANPCPSA